MEFAYLQRLSDDELTDQLDAARVERRLKGAHSYYFFNLTKRINAIEREQSRRRINAQSGSNEDPQA